MTGVTRRLVIAGLLLTATMMVLRSMPRVVSGVSIYTVVQAVAFLAILFALWRARGALGAFYRRHPQGRPGTVLGAVGVVVLFLLLVSAVSEEIEAGRAWDRVEKDLESDDPTAALALAGHLGRQESGPARIRILERIAEIGRSDREVITSVRGVLRTADDEAVRESAIRTLGVIMEDRDVIDTVAELPEADPAVRDRLAAALRARTEADVGGGPAAWRDWVANSLIPLEGERGYVAARTALRELGRFPEIVAAAAARIEDGDGADARELREHLADDRPGIRIAAARALEKRGGASDVFAVVDRLKTEEDPAAARALAHAVPVLDPDRADRLLADVARSARSEAARAAAEEVKDR